MRFDDTNPAKENAEFEQVMKFFELLYHIPLLLPRIF
jgi:hypothetical protein